MFYQIGSESNERMFLDKVSVQFPKSALTGRFPPSLRKGPITVFECGLFCQLKFHDEYMKLYPSAGAAILSGLYALAGQGYFEMAASQSIANACRDFIWGSSSLPRGFEFHGLEFAIDLIGVESLGTVKAGVLSVPVQGSGTIYTWDHKVVCRKVDLGHGKLKSEQKSFFTVYRKDIQVNLPRPVTRIEWRFEGKYTKLVNPTILFLPIEGVYQSLLPELSRVSIKLGVHDGLIFDPAVSMLPGSLIGRVLNDLFGSYRPKNDGKWGAY